MLNNGQTNKNTNKNANVEKKQNTITTTQKTISSSYNESYFENGHLKSYLSFSSKYAILKISKISVNAPIYFGLTQDILLKVVAQDSGSYFSGENGSIILAGHYYMNNFKRLGELKAGDIIEINELKVEPEYHTKNNKSIDLIIYNENFAIGIENKLEASLYNDLNDYANAIDKIHKNNYKIVLSIRAEQTKFGFINILYKDFFYEVKKLLKL